MAEEREESPRERTEAREEEQAQRGGRRARGGGGGRGAGGRHARTCPFCDRHLKMIDYKEVDELRHYLTERGKIKPRRKNVVCAKHQRRLAVAIKRARHLALLPFTVETTRS